MSNRNLLTTIKNIPMRFIKATKYSIQGIIHAFKKEEAFQLEIISFFILIIALCFIECPVWKKIAVIGVYLLIPLAELVNSAIEDICNLVSPTYNPLIKSAKDKGSAAVLFAIIITIFALIALYFVP